MSKYAQRVRPGTANALYTKHYSIRGISHGNSQVGLITTTASPILLNAYHRVMYHAYVFVSLKQNSRDRMGGSKQSQL